ncbi:class IV adenylate cyclase [Kitasatospora sp. RB6PN24]|uniref:class IV adenylate cyclase n=1 Tax=Kitasatospora humi TaxID=2893891 RepID=UPI001E64FC4D|nr:class IV adenylate cyclase [Kitasatospora humi]MCC9306956.1 class IV adenylate cyclase [Kitasatospora humi]
MAIEAELKAVVRDPEGVMETLEKTYGPGRPEVYKDTYYDTAGGALGAGDRELRIRTVHSADDTRTVLTYKGARVDEVSGSKPEHETRVEDAAEAHAILRGLGYTPAIQFEKRCRNYTVAAGTRRFLATLVRVPELNGTFIELETSAETEAELPEALAAVRSLLTDLGIADEDFTAELYTDAVAAAR